MFLTSDFAEASGPESAVESDGSVVSSHGARLPAKCVVVRSPQRWPGDLRHPAQPAESCWLPPLTRFTSGRRVGPDHRCGPRTVFRIALCRKCLRRRFGKMRGGSVRERPNRHAWKACDLHGSVGSNPTTSASQRRRHGAGLAFGHVQPSTASGRPRHRGGAVDRVSLVGQSP